MLSLIHILIEHSTYIDKIKATGSKVPVIMGVCACSVKWWIVCLTASSLALSLHHFVTYGEVSTASVYIRTGHRSITLFDQGKEVLYMN